MWSRDDFEYELDCLTTELDRIQRWIHEGREADVLESIERLRRGHARLKEHLGDHVADSPESDADDLDQLLSAFNPLPDGLFADDLFGAGEVSEDSFCELCGRTFGADERVIGRDVVQGDSGWCHAVCQGALFPRWQRPDEN